MYRFLLKSFLGISGLLAVSTQGQAVEVYLFKGAGDFSFINKNMHFSGGLQKLSRQLKAEGIHAEVRRYGAIDDAISTIRRRKPESVAFIGHSMGALASLGMAKKMRSMGVRVAYIGLIDIPGPVGVAGDNVEWAENYYSTFPVYGKLTNVRSHPNAKNIHVSGQVHTTMDDSKKVRNGMLSALKQIHLKEQQQYVPLDDPQFSQPQFVAEQGQQMGITDHYSQNINHNGDNMKLSGGEVTQVGVAQNEYDNQTTSAITRPSVEVPTDGMGFQQVDPTITSSISSDADIVRAKKVSLTPRKHYTRLRNNTPNR